MVFKHFASKNQLPGLCVNGTLVENGLRVIGFNGTNVFDHIRLYFSEGNKLACVVINEASFGTKYSRMN